MAALALGIAAFAFAQPAPKPAEPADAEFRAAASSLVSALAADRLNAVEITVVVAGPEGRRFRYPIHLLGEETVAEAVKLLSSAKPERRGRAPADPAEREKHAERLDCRLVFERNGDLVELEKRGEIFLELLAEDDGKPRPRPVTAGRLVVFDLSAERLELLEPADPRLHRATMESAKLHALLKAAVDAEYKRATEIWGEMYPFGMARSRLAEGIAYAALGYKAEAAACWKQTAAICKAQGKWEYLAKDAEARLKAGK